MSGALLLLADGRFPSGGHAHSNGYEPADRLIGLATADEVERFVANRLVTSGSADASFIAALVYRLGPDQTSSPLDWDLVDAELDARTPVPALRARSRALGRQWLRAGRRLWPDLVEPIPVDQRTETATSGPDRADGPHEVAAFASVASAAGLTPAEAAMTSLHHLVAGIVTAAIRLRGMDPYRLQAVQLALLPTIEEVARSAAAAADRPLADQTATSGPMFELLAQHHLSWDNRLFQS